MARIERWSLVGSEGSTPLAVRGEIHGDDRFSNGTPITSSRLAHLDPAGHFACTRNHTYELGTISDAFARWMADEGRTIAAYARALEAKDATATNRSPVTPIGRRALDVTRPTAPSSDEKTRLVADARRTVDQAPTVIVAVR